MWGAMDRLKSEEPCNQWAFYIRQVAVQALGKRYFVKLKMMASSMIE